MWAFRTFMRTRSWIIVIVSFIGAGGGLWVWAQGANGQNQSANDQLYTYTLDDLRSALSARHDMGLYPHSPVGLDKFTDRQIADNIVERRKAIYPHDMRQDYYQFKVYPDYQQDAESVAAIVAPPNFTWSSAGFQLVSLTLGQSQGPLCKDQPFLNQEAVAKCSAFVVGPDTIVTAHHCIKNDYKSYQVVFGYRMDSPSQLHPTQDVYGIKEIVKMNDSAHPDDDFIVLRTDRALAGHPPLPRRSAGSVEQNDGLYMLGFPRGLPIKLASGASVITLGVGTNYFRADLDAFFGNSGSPVFNAATHQVEGILVRGEEDYGYLRDESCEAELVCPKLNGCAGEDVTKISVLDNTQQASDQQQLQVPEVSRSDVDNQDKRLSAEKPVLDTPIFSRVMVRAAIGPKIGSSNGHAMHRVQLYLEASSDVLDQIKQVQYQFPKDIATGRDPYRPNPKNGLNRQDNFRISYIESGCVQDITPFLIPRTPSNAPIRLEEFNLCAIWPTD